MVTGIELNSRPAGWRAALAGLWATCGKLLLACATCTLVCASCAPAKPPNVLLLVSDTLRADYLQAYGNDRPTSPILNSLAARGTLFERAYAPAPWTLPSMAMLMTGRLRSDNSGDLGLDAPSLAERLRAQGYETFGVSANPLLFEKKGWARGFGDWMVRGQTPELSGTEMFSAERLANRSIKRLQQWVNQGPERGPFFLFSFFFDPHDPYEPSGELVFEPRLSAARRGLLESALPADQRALLTDEVYAEIEQLKANYETEILEMDRAIGRMLGRIRQLGELENTVIAFTADHGEGLWQRARPADEPPKDRAFFPPLYYGHGLTLHEEQVHVPLILAGPGVPKGVRHDGPVSLIDVVPTLLGLTGAPVLEDLHGLNLLDFSGLARRGELAAFNLRGSSLRVDGRYKLHVPREHVAAATGAEPQLFDLERDPRELEPIDDPERIAAMLERLAVFHELGVRTDSNSNSAISKRLLEELGYTESETSALGGNFGASESEADGSAPESEDPRR